MNKPLLTESEASARAVELLAVFDRCADVLSPDEQALAMAIRIREQAERDLAAQFAYNVADMIGSMANSHYARDISGELALKNWQAIAQMLRELKPLQTQDLAPLRIP